MINRLVIPDWLPEPLSNVSGDHWTRRSEKLRRANEIVWARGRMSSLMPVHGPCRVTITLVFPVRRRRDADNLYSRVKGVVDALVRGRWIDDDNTEVIDLRVVAVVDPGHMRTVIDLASVERVESPALVEG